MYWTIVLLLIVIISIIVYHITKNGIQSSHADNPSKQKSINQLTEYPYEKKMLLTKAEYAFYHVLKRKCDENDLLICPKVRMEDFINVTDRKNILKYRGYIRSRHIDFMICDNKLHLLAGIELDDSSHQSKDAANVDEFKNKVFKTIQLPLFRVKMSQGNYEIQLDKIIYEIEMNH